MEITTMSKRLCRLTRWLMICALALSITACGFQPRGQTADIGAIPGPLAITGIRVNSPLYRELRKQVNAAGQTLVDSVSESGAILRIQQYQSSSRVLSVDSRNRAVEYELEESARLSLRTPAGETLLAEQPLRVVRLLYRPSETILSSDRESALLRADMRRDLATRILRRISAAN